MTGEIILFIIGGIFSGFVAGLLGIGGGLLVVPFLAFVLPHLGFPEVAVMHVAVATSLTIIVGTSISSIIAHQQKGGILWPLVTRFLPGLIVGAAIAASIADLLPSSLLRIVFGLFSLFLAYGMGFKFKHKVKKKRKLPSKWKLMGAGAFISGFCNILGMGGGSLMVPYLNRYNLPMRNAVATSAVCGLPIALSGVIGLIVAGANEPNLPAGTTGYVYWPAFAAMVIPSIIFAPFGARLAHRMPAANLRRIFAIFLLLVGLDMLGKAFETVIKWI